MEREHQTEEGKHPSLPQEVEDLVHAGDRQLTEAADLVEFLVLHGNLNASRFKVASTSLPMMGLMRCGRDVTDALPSWTDITKGIKDQAP